MREEFVSFETALLAKEKGFRNRTHTFYWPEDGEFDEVPYCHCDFEILRTCECGSDEILTKLHCGELVEAPTQSLLLKWLRDVHKIHIIPDLPWIENGWTAKGVSLVNGSQLFSVLKYGKYQSYEAVIEVALIEALKRI